MFFFVCLFFVFVDCVGKAVFEQVLLVLPHGCLEQACYGGVTKIYSYNQRGPFIIQQSRAWVWSAVCSSSSSKTSTQ